ETLEQALAILPAYLPYLELVPEQDRTWTECVETTNALADRLAAAAGLTDVADLAAKVNKQLAELRRPITTDGLADLRTRSGRAGTQAVVLREVHAVLSLPFIPVEERVSLWRAGRDLARRLHEATARLDREEGPPVPTPEDETPPRSGEDSRLAARARRVEALVRLAGLKTEATADERRL